MRLTVALLPQSSVDVHVLVCDLLQSPATVPSDGVAGIDTAVPEPAPPWVAQDNALV